MYIRELLRLGHFPPFYFSPDGGGGTGDVGDFAQDLNDLGGEAGDDKVEDDDDDDTGSDKRDRSDRRGRRSSEDLEDDDPNGDKGGDEEDEEDEEVDPKKEKGEKKKSEEDDEEEEEEEKEEDEDEEKKPERIVGRPTIKQIKDSGILKTMPGVREIYFREQEFSKHFDDPEQAEEAAIKSTSYDRLEASVIEGKPEVMLGELAESNPKAFRAYAQNLLPAIRQISKDDYLAVTEPVIVELLQHATTYAKKLGDTQEGKNILNSAKHIANFVFANGGEIPEAKKQEKHPAEIELEKEREKAAQTEFKRAQTDINERIDKSLVGYLTENMPRGLSEIEKEHITEKSLDLAIAEIAKDKNFGMKMRGLWKRAQLAQYPETLKVAIINAQVARAKPLLKEFRDKLTAKALKARGGRSREDQDDKDDKPNKDQKKRSFNSNGRGGSSGRRPTVLDSSKIDYGRTSDKDILDDEGGNRVKLKGQR